MTKRTEFLEQADIDAVFALERRGSGRFEQGFERPRIAPEEVIEPVEEPTDE
jgi:hypothetical protein